MSKSADIREEGVMEWWTLNLRAPDAQSGPMIVCRQRPTLKLTTDYADLTDGKAGFIRAIRVLRA